MPTYTVYYTYLAECAWEDGCTYGEDIRCVEEVHTLSELHDLLRDLRSNGCFDIWWTYAEADGERW